ncbi:transcription factor MYB3R-2-like [Tasmannia lanceolata]|uniref:transcription factor MYB3R-2-like n=1 Tax=Tasmannia lanceolata TaxID=3420 RepID=UPI00406410D1
MEESDDSSADTNLSKLRPTQGRITGPTRRSTKGGWTEMEDSALTKAVTMHNGKNWKKIAECFPGRSDVQCLHRWQKVLNPELIKGPWTKEEDDCIIGLVEKYGCKKWSIIAKSLPGRIGKQCRERWHNHLNPAIKKDAWTKEEEVALIRAHQLYGNKWAEIARFLPGRADNSIKNHWNCSVKKKLDSYSEDLYDHVKLEENVGAVMGRKNSSTVVSLDQKLRIKDDAKNCLVHPVLGNVSAGEWHSDLNLAERKVYTSSKNYREKSPTKIPSDDKYSILSGPSSVRNRHDGSTKNCSHDTVASPSDYVTHETADNTYPSLSPLSERSVIRPSFSPSSILETQFPLGVTTLCTKMNNTCELVPFVATKRFLESPKTPRQGAIIGKSLDAMDMRPRCEANDISTLLASACEFVGNVQIGNHSKVPVTPINFGNSSTFGDLCYVPPNLPNLDVPFADGKISNTGNCIEQAHSPACYSTPPNHELNVVSVDNGSSPESILRSAAKSFKNTPSIIRKRGRDSKDVDSSSCTRQVMDEISDNSLGSIHLCLPKSYGAEDLNCGDLINVKRLFHSPSVSLKHSSGAAVNSVEKRLEYAFDLEWEKANAKCTTSGAVGGHSDVNIDASSTTFMPLDNLHKLRGGSQGLNRNFMLLGARVNCSL